MLTSERLKELEQDVKRGLLVDTTGLRDCLEEIKRLNKVIEDISDELDNVRDELVVIKEKDLIHVTKICVNE